MPLPQLSLFRHLPATLLTALICQSLPLSAQSNRLEDSTELYAPETLAPEVSPHKNANLRRSKSSSGQFVVYADALAIRGQVCVFSEKTKTDLHAFLGSGVEGHWDHPIVIKVDGGDGGGRVPLGQSIVTDIRPYDFGGWLLQLEVFLGASFSREELEDELIRLLLAERILDGADQKVIEKRQQKILPDWLHKGVVGVIRYRREGRPSDTFQAVWKADTPLDLDEILDSDFTKLDALSRRIFEASSTALVYALHRQRQGRLSLRQMIGDLGRSDIDQRKMLARHFPEFKTSPDAVDKWWALEMAALAEGSAFESLNAERTESRIASLLEITFTPIDKKKEKKGLLSIFQKKGQQQRDSEEENEEKENSPKRRTIKLRQLEELKRHPMREKILLAKAEELLALGLRAFPLHRPIVTAYTDLLSEASQGKKIRNFETRLDELEAQRRSIITLVKRAEHLLDFHEATETRQISSDFDDYLRVMESFQQPTPRRPDPISSYLDAVESEWR